jgi:hypothetical protein
MGHYSFSIISIGRLSQLRRHNILFGTFQVLVHLFTAVTNTQYCPIIDISISEDISVKYATGTYQVRLLQLDPVVHEKGSVDI